MNPAAARARAPTVRGMGRVAAISVMACLLAACSPTGDEPGAERERAAPAEAPAAARVQTPPPAEAVAAAASGRRSTAPPIPSAWMLTAPHGDPIEGHFGAKLIARLGHAEITAAERRLGPPVGAGELRGWWLRPITPRPTGAWLLLSVSGAIYGITGPPGLFDDPGFINLVRAGRSWRSLLRRALTE